MNRTPQSKRFWRILGPILILLGNSVFCKDDRADGHYAYEQSGNAADHAVCTE